MPEPQVTVRSTEAGRATEVVVPAYAYGGEDIFDMLLAQIPRVRLFCCEYMMGIRQPNGPDVVALASETLRIAAGRVERVQ